MGKRLVVVELFAGIGGFSLGIKEAYKEITGSTEGIEFWANDIDPYACSIFRYNFVRRNKPDGVKDEGERGEGSGDKTGQGVELPDGGSNRCDDNQNTEENTGESRGAIYEGDLQTIDPANIPTADIITFGWPCFVGETLILTKRGHIPIKEVEIGDEVLTHRGRWRAVIAKQVVKNRATRGIKAQGIIDTITTDEHPYLSKDHTRKRRKAEWRKAKDIKGYHIGRVLPPVTKVGGGKDFWRIVGRYIADGWLTNRDDRRDGSTCRVIICESHDKADILESEIKKKFHCQKQVQRTVTRFNITNTEFAEFLKPAGRGARNKQIPTEWFGMSPVQARAFLGGYFAGDGDYNRSFGKQRCCTVSAGLALGIAMLIERAYGIRASIAITDTTPYREHKIEGRTIKNRAPYLYTVYYCRSNRKAFVERNTSWGRVRESAPTGKRQTVYNLSIKDDESYLANGALVHNCQDNSVSGKRAGQKEGTRSGLLFEAVRILRAKKPKYFIAENVPGLFSVNDGRDFYEAIRMFADAGYDCQWQVLDTRWFLPQNRKRIIFVGHLIGNRRPEVFPIGEASADDNGPIQEG